MDALKLGDEAIVEIADFRLEGRAIRNVCPMIHRAGTAGSPSRSR